MIRLEVILLDIVPNAFAAYYFAYLEQLIDVVRSPKENRFFENLPEE